MVLLVLLLALNVFQAYRALTWPLRRENQALARALDRVNEMAERRKRDDDLLLDQLEQIAARGQRIRTVYRAAAAAQPLPEQCAPGQARADAVNAALGPQGKEGKP